VLLLSLFPFEIYNENLRWQFGDFRKEVAKKRVI
jgi:hypothetical protein